VARSFSATPAKKKPGRFTGGAKTFSRISSTPTSATLAWVLGHGPIVLVILAGTIGLNVWLFAIIPKGFFPNKTRPPDGRHPSDSEYFVSIDGGKISPVVDIVRQDPAVQTVVGSTGAGDAVAARIRGGCFVDLKPLGQRQETSSRSSRGFARNSPPVRARRFSSHPRRKSEWAETEQLALTNIRCKPTIWQDLRTWTHGYSTR